MEEIGKVNAKNISPDDKFMNFKWIFHILVAA